jgi:SRSO17 transposase
VRPAEGQQLRDGRHLPGDEVWLLGERRASGERKDYLSNLPPGTPLEELAATIKARWICEQAHQRLKGELGLGHFEGRSWTGLHRHALLAMLAFCFLQHLRLKERGESAAAGTLGPPPRPSLPTVRRWLIERLRARLAVCPCCGADLRPLLPSGVPR